MISDGGLETYVEWEDKNLDLALQWWYTEVINVKKRSDVKQSIIEYIVLVQQSFVSDEDKSQWLAHSEWYKNLLRGSLEQSDLL